MCIHSHTQRVRKKGSKLFFLGVSFLRCTDRKMRGSSIETWKSSKFSPCAFPLDPKTLFFSLLSRRNLIFDCFAIQTTTHFLGAFMSYTLTALTHTISELCMGLFFHSFFPVKRPRTLQLCTQFVYVNINKIFIIRACFRYRNCKPL